VGVDEADIPAAIATQLLQQADLTAAGIGKKLDRVRDEWILDRTKPVYLVMVLSWGGGKIAIPCYEFSSACNYHKSLKL